MAVIPRDEGEHVLNAIINAGHTATFLETKGGVLRQSQYTLFIVVDDKNLAMICQIIQENCKVDMFVSDEESLKEETGNMNSDKLGGAVVFVWKLHRAITY